MKPVVIVRHGQTEYNIQGKAQGWSDSPLTRQGVLQGMALRKWMNLQNLHFDRIYSSDLGRALHTAALLKDDHTQVYGAEGLREITFGDLDGKDSSAFAGVNWETDYARHGGESYDQAIVRAWRTMLAILGQELREHPEDESPVMILTHGAILKGFYLLLEKDPAVDWPEEPEMFNCETFLCELNPQTGQLILKDTYYPRLHQGYGV